MMSNDNVLKEENDHGLDGFKADQSTNTQHEDNKKAENSKDTEGNGEASDIGEDSSSKDIKDLEDAIEPESLKVSSEMDVQSDQVNENSQPPAEENSNSQASESTEIQINEDVKEQVNEIAEDQVNENAGASVNGNSETEVTIPNKGNNIDNHLTLNGHSNMEHLRQSSVSITSSATPVDNSHIFRKTFDHILGSKEAKKNENLRNKTQRALDSLNDRGSRDPQILFDALKLACETSNNELKTKAIDIFAKIFDYAQFDDEIEKVKMTDASVDIISNCFEGEGTDPEVELQVVRALMHSILLMPCHGASLLKAVRQIYNVFIFSLSARNQAIAQGILTQVIGAIFQRIHDRSNLRSSNSESTHNLRTENTSFEEIPSDNSSRIHQKLTLQNLERFNDDSIDADRVDEANNASASDKDLVVKDAFLIFRAMCKLSVKSLESEGLDMKSHSVRSKLLSLHIIHTILREHIDVFLSNDVIILSSNNNEETRLISAVRQYICLTLSRNAASPLAPVFELSLEIFWLIISNLRSEFKREIPVFWDEIYFPIAEIKTSTPHQKRYLLAIIERLCNDSRCIIEFYLNYDCDSSMPNICEKIIDYLTRLSLIRVEVTPQQKAMFYENRRKGISVYDIGKIANLTSSTMSSKPPEPEIYHLFPLEYALKITSIGCSVAFLRSLYSWAQKGMFTNKKYHNPTLNVTGSSQSLKRDRSTTVDSSSSTGFNTRNGSFSNNPTDGNNDTDDPEQFENLKQRKKAFLEGVKQFNQKPKKGIKYFIDNRFILSDSPSDIALFLLETDSLDKAAIGEYLGEGDELNISIMHAFVDQMDFTNSPFVNAMRLFLQSFRLPGEAQKIDRFMLKFAERYVLGNPGVFANADAAYILAYSVILLNTDLHSPQIKNRMTFDNFVANNNGINDGNNLDTQFLKEIYDEILENEIKLQSEQHAALLAGDLTISSQSGGFFGGRDLSREAYYHASKEMSTKTEKLVRNLGRRTRGEDLHSSTFYAASHVYHVKSIFDTLWMSILAGLTPPFKEYDDVDITATCLEGIKLSIRIACMFDLSYARTSFIGALVQFENLPNYEEMKPKNVDAIYIMLELAVTEGDSLKDSWLQILTSISQIERLQLIAQGVDRDSIPDVSIAKLVNRNSVESSNTSHGSFFSQFSGQTSAAQTASNRYHNQHLTDQVAKLLVKTELEVAIDRIFTNSANLNGDGIVHFVKALSEVSSEEIESSGQSSNPRTFSLLKVVDICYYNMNRIRLEWSQLWAIMGETFNKVGSHTNLVVAFFALDSLRQLSMRFLEIDELSHFKFQKEFLKPFEYVITYNDSLEVKDMVLECINNMILARAGQIKSGWKTIFGVLTVAAKEKKESLVLKSYRMANLINKEYITVVRIQESFADLVCCFTELAKNERFQKVSLQSLDVLLRLINQIANFSFKEILISEDDTSDQKTSVENENLVKLWFPVLFAFYDIIMTGEELEVRSRALTYLFNVLHDYGKYFQNDFWDMVCAQLLFPIFNVLNTHQELELNDSNDRLSVWLSTTLIQALKSMINLFSHYIDDLRRLIDGFLNVLVSCICQENDTISKVGRECLLSLLTDNAASFEKEEWDKIVKVLKKLFDSTTAQELFTSDPLRNRVENNSEENDMSSNLSSGEQKEPASPFTEDKSENNKPREKFSIIVKSVLQLLLIQTVSELFEDDSFYDAVSYDHLLQMADLLNGSYQFARKFNDDYDLRVRLWNAGIIERLPNLLKQESSSSAVYINIMFRMYCDDDKTDDAAKESIINQVIPLCTSIIERYAEFDETNQQRNISTWKPVIVEIFQGYVELDDKHFLRCSPAMYALTLRLFSKSIPQDLRFAIRSFLARVGEEFVKIN